MRQITFKINEECNFNCFYCSANHYRPNTEIQLDKLEKAFKRIGKVEIFQITGGEPLLLEEKVLGLIDIIDAERIYLFSNLSLLAPDFLDKVKKKIEFFTTYHYFDIGFDDYIEKVSLASRFRVHIAAILHPMLTERFIEGVSARFRKWGKKVSWKSCSGMHNGVRYPNVEYLDKFSKYLKTSERELFNSKSRISFKGKMCAAGKDAINIFNNGDVFRCVAAKVKEEKMGNIYDEGFSVDTQPRECVFPFCNCYYQGQRYVV